MLRYRTAYLVLPFLVSLLISCQPIDDENLPIDADSTPTIAQTDQPTNLPIVKPAASVESMCEISTLQAASTNTSPIIPDRAFMKLGWGQVLDMAVDPGGACAAVLTTQALRVYDLETLESAVLSIHELRFGSVDWSPDGTQIAAAPIGTDVKVWNVESGDETVIYADEELFGVSELVWSPDNSMLAINFMFQEIRVINGDTGEIISSFQVEYGGDSISWFPDSTQFVTTDGSKILVCKIGADSSEVIDLPSPSEYTSLISLAFSPIGDKLAIAFGYEATDVYDGSGIQLIDWQTHNELFVVGNGDTGPYSVAWSADGTQLISGWSDGRAIISDASTGAKITAISHNDTGFAFGQNGVISAKWAGNDQIVSISSDGLLQLSKPDGQTVTSAFVSTHTSEVEAITWTQDGSILATAGFDSQILLWDTSNYEAIRRITDPDMTYADQIAFSPDNSILAVRALQVVHPGFVGNLFLFDSVSDEPPTQVNQEYDDVYGMEWYSDDQFFFWQYSNLLSLWDISEQKQVSTFSHSVEQVWDIVELSDGTLYAAGVSGNGRVGIWPIDRWDDVKWLETGDYWIIQLRFSPDGSKLALLNDNDQAILWDVQTKQMLYAVDAFPYPTPGILAFSPDGTLLITNLDGALAIWETSTGKQLQRLELYATSVAFSPDSQILGLGHPDGTITLWNIATLISN